LTYTKKLIRRLDKRIIRDYIVIQIKSNRKRYNEYKL